MAIHEIRAANFQTLYQSFLASDAESGNFKRGQDRRFGEACGISACYISHIKNGIKAIGNSTARKLETAFGRPDGWLDLEQSREQWRESARKRDFCDHYFATFKAHPEAFKEAIIALLTQKIAQTILGIRTQKPST